MDETLEKEIGAKLNRMARSIVSLIDGGDVFEQISFMAMLFNSETGVLVKVNSRMLSYLGYKESEMVGRPYTDFVASCDMNDTVEANNEFKQDIKKTTIFSNHWVAKDGKELPMYWVRERAKDSKISGYSFGFAFCEMTIG